jgi:hypothetical protein
MRARCRKRDIVCERPGTCPGHIRSRGYVYGPHRHLRPAPWILAPRRCGPRFPSPCIPLARCDTPEGGPQRPGTCPGRTCRPYIYGDSLTGSGPPLMTPALRGPARRSCLQRHACGRGGDGRGRRRAVRQGAAAAWRPWPGLGAGRGPGLGRRVAGGEAHVKRRVRPESSAGSGRSRVPGKAGVERRVRPESSSAEARVEHVVEPRVRPESSAG